MSRIYQTQSAFRREVEVLGAEIERVGYWSQTSSRFEVRSGVLSGLRVLGSYVSRESQESVLVVVAFKGHERNLVVVLAQMTRENSVHERRHSGDSFFGAHFVSLAGLYVGWEEIWVRSGGFDE
ncbi:MAG: hypothetical protein DHS20C13_26120 [Thermodesulfobacteriota bacterium]|nr:MAG: hypothetical protein DHS20C13_26120 [Thermodesulfobacteriota bacterium]